MGQGGPRRAFCGQVIIILLYFLRPEHQLLPSLICGVGRGRSRSRDSCCTPAPFEIRLIAQVTAAVQRQSAE
jgi:hypothetical protein